MSVTRDNVLSFSNYMQAVVATMTVLIACASGALLPAPYASPTPYAVAPVYAYSHPPPHHAPPPPPPPPPAAVYHTASHHVAPVVPIVSQSYDANPDGSYQFQYESGDGSQRQEQGVPKYAPGAPEGAGGVAVQGRYAYASPEGPVQVEYIADENGYQPSGSHIHPEIIKAVAAQVAYARSEGPVPYHAPPPPPPPPAIPPNYVRAYPGPSPPPPGVAVTYSPYTYKA